MKIYRLTQDQNTGYDTYDSCVVIAENEQDAKTIDPLGHIFDENKRWSDWADTYDGIKVELVGDADPSQKRGVVCASFNAG